MARRELGPDALAVAQACAAALAHDAGPVAVGVSGGADSLALAAGVAWAARRLPVAPVAVVVDHGLQEGSRQVAEAAAAQCRGLGLTAEVVTVDVVPTGAGPEADARAARHAALLAHEGPVLLGHTLDDQAETVLLGLARGSGTRSLAGMSPRTGRLVRPLLGLRRATTLAACAQWGLEPWTDPHNADPGYARVRVRERVLPLLEAELGPGVAEALARTAALARADADLLDAQTPVAAEHLDVDAVAALPDALASRHVRGWLVRAGAREPSAGHVEAVRDLVRAWRGQGPIDVPGLRVARRGSIITAEPRDGSSPRP